MSIDEEDNFGENPLMLACLRGYNKIFKRNKDLNKKSKRCKIAEALLRSGSTLMQFKNDGDSNPLHWSCYYGDYCLTKLLLTKCFDLFYYYNQHGAHPIDYLILDRKESKDPHADAAVNI